MRTLQTCLLAFVFLALAATAGAEDGTRHVEERPADSPAAEAVWAPSTLDPEDERLALGRLNLIEELILNTPMTFASEAPSDGFGGGCYTGCFDATMSQNICGSGKVAEVQVTGPINNCGLGDITCKTTCFGPIVQCNYFALCSGGL